MLKTQPGKAINTQKQQQKKKKKKKKKNISMRHLDGF